jgi:hypothetical protein
MMTHGHYIVMVLPNGSITLDEVWLCPDFRKCGIPNLGSFCVPVPPRLQVAACSCSVPSENVGRMPFQ